MAGGRTGGNEGLLVASDRRAMFISEGIINHSFEDFPYDRVTTVTVARHMLTAEIVLATAGVTRVIDHVNNNAAEAVAAVLRERVEATTRERHSPPPAQHHPAPNGIAAELRELAALRDEGVLTNAEFEEQKTRLLQR